MRILVALSLTAFLLVACQSQPSSPPGGEARLRVVTTTSVFADMVSQVGGELVRVTSLVPHNGDVHTFEPRPSDIRSVAEAQLLIMNGLGLDDWLAKTIRNAADEGVPLIRLAEDLPGADSLPGEEAGTRNPHLFLDVVYARGYVERIAAALKQADPQHADRYAARASAYLAELGALDGWVRQQIQTIPDANRKIVTFHDAFAYYAREYGLEVVGVAVRAPGQDPSAGYVARLVDAVEANGVKAIFSERQFPATLADQIAAETGARVVANLYDDSLGDAPVTTYVAMIRWDTEQIVRGLA